MQIRGKLQGSRTDFNECSVSAVFGLHGSTAPSRRRRPGGIRRDLLGGKGGEVCEFHRPEPHPRRVLLHVHRAHHGPADQGPLRISLRPKDAAPCLTRAQITVVTLDVAHYSGDAEARVLVRTASVRYRTAHREDFLFREHRVDNDLAADDAVRIDAPLNREALRNCYFSLSCRNRLNNAQDFRSASSR